MEIIYPPADIKVVVDKTAQFVAKNGSKFEQRIRQDQDPQNSQRFAFLDIDNPYNAYYQMKLKEFQEGKETDTKPAIPQAILDRQKKESERAKKREQFLSLTDSSHTKINEVVEPEPDIFAVQHPFISSLDLEIIRITALFVARNGQRFLTGLASREKTNAQFDFLRPSHYLFPYFSSLIECYTKCLIPPQEQVDRIKKIAHDKFYLLAKSRNRFEWEAKKEEKIREMERERAAQRAEMQSVDWKEFVIVDTIDFTQEDADKDLPAPIDFELLGDRPPPPIKPTMDTTKTIQEEQPIINVQTVPDVLGPTESDEIGNVTIEDHTSPDDTVNYLAMDVGIETIDDGDETIKVVKGYVRKKKQGRDKTLQKCPITGQLVPEADMSTHLKNLLLDPQYKTQRDLLLSRAKQESAFAPLEDIEGNLANFVIKRPDICGIDLNEIDNPKKRK
ncbi:splicing factor 3A subunit 1 [Babesia microti strain RI]|uniref:Splicing factor 3A subunit 1 n=1 Tax=Babesia microti (strain RI) TaxID=1133968 RepID=I7IHG6_BABMR|nr:splicing factor 3A subunit 1 [Babesia microti strain RI]CCF75777.2 splicing factor 3A subunit 1 [Babesia microti strain RI]|eukprot:XP_021337200.1 splicing factor 3A subunit 1 [Babesia microti strain RI]